MRSSGDLQQEVRHRGKDHALDVPTRQLLPAVRAYLAQQANEFVALGKAELESGFLREHIYDLDENCRQLNDQTAVLRNAVAQLGAYEDPATAAYCRDVLIPAMRAVRETADYLETVVDKRFWPLPTYDEILFDEQAWTGAPLRGCLTGPTCRSTAAHFAVQNRCLSC